MDGNMQRQEKQSRRGERAIAATRNSVVKPSGNASTHRGLPQAVYRWSAHATTPLPWDMLTIGEEDVREHASALALASLGNDFYQETHKERCSDEMVTTATSSNKRKFDQLEQVSQSHGAAPPTAITWPSLEFSESLRPLEVQVKLGGWRGDDKCHVTVASCVAEAVALSQTWEGASTIDASSISDSQNSLAGLCANTTDYSQSSQDPEPSQCSDWHFLASQTSSFALEELPDSQPLSQTSVYNFWC